MPFHFNHRERSIIHLNVADFAVAVERAVDSRLRLRPVIVAPGTADRAAVYDMSEEAYAAGIRKGMLLRRALRLCRDARVIAPHPDRYEQAMRELFRQTLPYSPLIENGETDGHLFLDATGTSRLFAPPMDLAWRLRRQIRKDLGLDPIWSVASNKLVAKVATRLVKPAGEYRVAAGEEEAFLAPLPICLIPGIEGDDLRRLQEFNITRVHQVAALGPERLEVPFGARSQFLWRIIRGIDDSPVLPAGEKPPAVSADHEFGTDTNDSALLDKILYGLVEKTGRELRRRGRAAGRMTVILDYSDGIRRVRQALLRPASANDFIIFENARRALSAAWMRRVRIRHIRLVCDRLAFPPAQLELFADDKKKTEKRDRLLGAIDRIRRRFGETAVQPARMLAA